tara:strand:+ start:7329 stop:7754 length:426 start_codon:yes stop_codon:yes gene_type:complete
MDGIKEHTTKVFLNRVVDNGYETLGYLSAYEGVKKIYECKTLELPYKANIRGVSAIPVGSYRVVKRNSSKYGDHFHVTGVQNRSLILIHVANFKNELRGCIAVGETFFDIDRDKELDVTSSRKTMKELLSLLPSKFVLHVT